jgi:hypothetical protein
MKITRKKLAANRRNAQKSTGPKTAEGKAAIAANAVRHGLAAAFAVLPHEDQAAFNRMLQNYHTEFNPQTEHTTFLVQQLAQSRWRLERIRRLEAIAFEYLILDENGALDETNPDARIVVRLAGKTGDPLPILHRYAVEAERSYFRAHRELTQIESRKKRNEASDAQVWLKEQLQQIPLAPLPDFDDPFTSIVPNDSAMGGGLSARARVYTFLRDVKGSVGRA